MSEHAGQLLFFSLKALNLSLFSHPALQGERQSSDPQSWGSGTPASTLPQTTQVTSQAIARKAGPSSPGRLPANDPSNPDLARLVA